MTAAPVAAASLVSAPPVTTPLVTTPAVTTPLGPAPIVFMGLLGWDSHNAEELQLVCQMARRGHPVVYLAPLGVRDPGLRGLGDGLRRLRRRAPRRRLPPGVHPAALAVLPGRTFGPIVQLNQRLVRWRLAAVLRSAAVERPILWLRLPTPELVDGIDALRPRAVVYERIDDYAAYPQYAAADRDRLRRYEERLVARADLVITLTATVAERLPPRARPSCRTCVVPLGVDLDSFGRPPGPVPPDLARLPRPRLGVVAGLDERVDLDLLAHLAAAEPGWSVVLVGPAPAVRGDRAPPPVPPNVHLLGRKPYELVPEYLAGLDVCLIPYRRTRWTEGCFPAKLLEYLASGRPVVATDLPALAPYATVVDLAPDAASFLAACRRAVLDADPTRVARRRAVAAAESLHARCATLDELLGSLPA